MQIAVETLPVGDPVYEFGSYLVAGQEDLADLRPLFPGKKYIGCDMRAGPGVDKIVDVREIDLPDGVAGTVVSLDTIEHVEFVREAVNEFHRVLAPGGMLILSSVLHFQIHDYPHDYWRFTPEAFRSLLRPFAVSHVDFAGDPEFPHTIVAVAFKGTGPAPERLEEFRGRLREWKRVWRPLEGKRWTRFIKPLLPPIVVDFFRYVRDRRRS